MQLITRCPQCETAFSFEASQLSLAQGWVRCGRCAMLFEADKYLFERNAVRLDEQKENKKQKSEGHSNQALLTPSADNLGVANKIDQLHTDLKSLHEALDENSNSYIGDENSDYDSHDLPLGVTLDLSPELEKMKSLSLELQGFSGVQVPLTSTHKEALLNEASESHNSKLDARDKGETRGSAPSKISTKAQVFLATLLILIAVGQILWAKKEVIGAFSAQSHLAVQSLCNAFGTDLDWPIEPGSLKIESSSFKPSSEDHFKVKLRLKNHQDYAVKTPWLELSLLGADESVLVRKVFSTRELELQQAIAPDKDLVISFTLKVDEQIASSVIGYRLDFFYP